MAELEHCFVCKFCHRHFTKEANYLQHMCKQMKREQEFKSTVGQAALQYYHMWMKAQNRLPPQPAAFLASKYFRTFINFVHFAKKVNLPRPDRFIKLMVDKKYPPTMWTTNDVYTIYLEYLDQIVSPIEHIRLSVDTLMTVAERRDIDVCDVFDVLDAIDIIQLLQARKLSPWVLLFSKKFKKLFVQNTTIEQRQIIESLIRPDYWGDKIQNHPHEIDIVKSCVKELDI